ncbi:MAG: AbrB/MazE/SpoVT family DNA-binding domain-containing protein [Promethearchaeota archaeon]
MKELKKKYIRSVIKLGNSYAMTFPQDWTNQARLKEKSEVSLYPIDKKSIVIRTIDKNKQKTIFTIDGSEWPIKLIKQAIISAFKLNIDEILIQNTKRYQNKNSDELYELLVDLRREIIGLDFKENVDKHEYSINFLLDTNKTDFSGVLNDLANVFNTLIRNVIEGELKKNMDMILAEIDRKYSLGTRILVTGLSEYPQSKIYRNLPIIRFLGDRVVLLYIRDFIERTLILELLPHEIIVKYSSLLNRIPKFLINILQNYDNIDLEHISNFHKYLIKLNSLLNEIEFKENLIEEQQMRNIIKYYLSSFETFFDIAITRLIESEIGMV